MKASRLLSQLEHMGLDTIAGVPDSTLKQFCDGVQTYQGKMSHYVTANEGAAVGVAIGSYLATGRPACVYMQNSGIGNAVNPLASLANGDVYGIPMLFIVGWRGEPGVKDEPQHVFQGKITCQLFETLAVAYSVIDSDTTDEQMDDVLRKAEETLSQGEQFAIIVKKGTFEKEEPFSWANGNPMVREEVLGRILQSLPRDTVIVSTTGKISRELYEQSDAIYGGHENIFMTVGGMGHAAGSEELLSHCDQQYGPRIRGGYAYRVSADVLCRNCGGSRIQEGKYVRDAGSGHADRQSCQDRGRPCSV